MSDRLGELREQVQDAYRYSLEGRQWRELAQELDYTGLLVKSHEITVGPQANGWHPHIHAILLFDRPLQSVDQARLEDVLYERWTKRLVEKHGRQPPTREHGVRVVQGDSAGDYVAKLGLGREISALALKKGRQKSHLTPFQLLAHLYEKRDSPKGQRGQTEALWEEYVRETKGKHLLNWGRTESVKQLRESVAGGEEAPDTEEASEPRDSTAIDDDGGTERIATLTSAAWRLVQRQEAGPKILLRKAQRHGWDGVRRTLLEYGRNSPWLQLSIDDERRRIDAFTRPGGLSAWAPG